jgi:hypothetical protein
MSGHWVVLAQLRFRGPRGPRFLDHALDAIALDELGKFQKIITETASVLWYQEHPEAGRLPNRFEENTRLYIRKIVEGSVAIPLETYVEEPEDQLFETGDRFRELKQALRIASRTYRAATLGERVPAVITQDLLKKYEEWGNELSDDEEIEIIVPEEQPAVVSIESRKALASFSKGNYEDSIKISGEVIEADVRLNRFHLWFQDRRKIQIDFSHEQENEVTQALKDHDSVRLEVVGTGEHGPTGDLLRVVQVSSLKRLDIGESGTRFEPNAPWIGDIIRRIAQQIPDDELSNLPEDLSTNIDHYLYGWPKK